LLSSSSKQDKVSLPSRLHIRYDEQERKHHPIDPVYEPPPSKDPGKKQFGRSSEFFVNQLAHRRARLLNRTSIEVARSAQVSPPNPNQTKPEPGKKVTWETISQLQTRKALPAAKNLSPPGLLKVTTSIGTRDGLAKVTASIGTRDGLLSSIGTRYGLLKVTTSIGTRDGLLKTRPSIGTVDGRGGHEAWNVQGEGLQHNDLPTSSSRRHGRDPPRRGRDSTKLIKETYP
jgi:hypothetical protein